jgi:hypothetical protein
MKVNEAKQAIVSSYHAKQPLMIWGPPGVGKSSGVKQAAAELGVDLIDLRLPLLEPIDLRGLPSIQTEVEQHVVGKTKTKREVQVARWSRPSFLPSSGEGILFLDELPQAVPGTQAAASQLILDRRVGEYVLPDGWHVIAAGNRLSDKAATHAMPSHVANRFVHLNVEVDVDAWVQWALGAEVDIRVIAFIKFRRALLHSFDPQAKAMAFPTPRSYEFVSNLLKRGNMPASLLLPMLQGAIGDGAAAELFGFLKVFEKLVDCDSIFLNPNSAAIPLDNPAALYAVTSNLVNRAKPDNMGAVVTYFNRISDAGRPEFSVAAMAELDKLDSDGKLKRTRAFIEWAAKHNHLMA